MFAVRILALKFYIEVLDTYIEKALWQGFNNVE